MIRDTSAMDRDIPQQGPLRRRLRWGIAAAVVLVATLALLPSLRRWLAGDQSVSAAQIRLAPVVRGDLVHDIAVQGRVVAASRPTLYSPATGIAALSVREGAQVSQGELLVTVESPELESRLAQERATHAALASSISRLELAARQQNLQNEQRVDLGRVQRDAAAREVDRNQKLFELGLINEIELERARDALTMRTMELEQATRTVELEREMLTFELEDARLRLGRQGLVVTDVERQVAELSVRAPFDGIVATVELEDRDAVVRGQALLGVVDLSDLEVAVAIPEAFADDVSPGIAAIVLLDGRETAGTLTRVAPEVRGSQVEGRVSFAGPPPPGLRQNQRVSTRLVLDRRDAVLKIPRGPFLEADGGRRLWVVADGIAQAREVELGAVSVTEVEIVRGVSEGDEIVLTDLSRFAHTDTLLIR